ncbi:inversin-B-like [Physella acuta]|uniref:inversin-B-like n=1 Tax=Physella acuta TaxID=109671 RepID=UPI0027DCA112|nr:inversin-B-like [Physella acuta]
MSKSQHDAREMFVAIAKESVQRLQAIIPNVLDLNARDSYKRTPAIASVGISDKDARAHVFRLLLRHGCDVNAQDQNGRTALMMACMEKEKIDVVEILVKNESCDLNLRDNDGNTALHLAVDSGNAAAIRLLLNFSTNNSRLKSNTTNRAGLTPLQLAEKLQHVRCVRMLVKNGVDSSKQQETEAKKTRDIKTAKYREEDTLQNISQNYRAASNYNERLVKNGVDSSKKQETEVKKTRDIRTAKRKEEDSLQNMSQNHRAALNINERLVKNGVESSLKPETAMKRPRDLRTAKHKEDNSLLDIVQGYQPSPTTNERLPEKIVFSKSRPKSEVLPLPQEFVHAFAHSRPLSDRRVVSYPRELYSRAGLVKENHALVYEESSTGFAVPALSSQTSARILTGNVARSSRDLQFSQAVKTKRVLTPIAPRSVFEETRPITPVGEKSKGRLPSISSGKSLHLVYTRETTSEIF